MSAHALSHAFQASTNKPIEKLILIFLANIDQDWIAKPTLGDLSRFTGRSQDRCRHALAALQDAGAVRILEFPTLSQQSFTIEITRP